MSGPQFDEPEDSPAADRRRLRIDLLLGGALLVGVLLVGRTISGGTDSPSSADSSSGAPTGSPSLRPASGSAAPATSVVALPSATSSDPATCPRAVRCSVEDAGADAALAAVQERFPRATVTAFHSVRMHSAPWAGRLWYRELRFRLDSSAPLEIRISIRSHPVQGQWGQVGTQMFLVEPLGQYVVRVTVPQALGLRPADLAAVAGDDRLLLG